MAVLHLLKDVTANASLLTLLTGPRWAIGPRDLKLLGDRARELAGAPGPRPGARIVDDHLVAIADGIDPAEIPCLDDALHDPGDAAVLRRGAGAVRAARCASCGCSASHVGEPLLDIVRRIIDTTGVDVELASAVTPAAAARRDNLDLFVRAVADFQAVDGDVTLLALLAYLTAEEEESKGLEVVAPSAADSVKLLTVHRAKGLEWGSVFLAGVCVGRASRRTSRTLWTSSPAVLPAPLRGDAADLPAARAATTRRRSTTTAPTPGPTTAPRSCGSATSRSPAPRTGSRSRRSAGARGPRRSARPSTRASSASSSRSGASRRAAWRDAPAKGDPNPYAAEDPSRPWPPAGIGAEAQRRLDAAELVRAADPDGRGRRPRHGRERPGR